MKVLVATREMQGFSSKDFCFCQDEEILLFPIFECTDHGRACECGCSRSFSGTQSLKATTTAKVVEMKISTAEFVCEIHAAYMKGKWDQLFSKQDLRDKVKDQVARLLNCASFFPVGTIVERSEEKVRSRGKLSKMS
jgi:hypothetical protein